MAHIQPCQLLFGLKTAVEYSLNQSQATGIISKNTKRALLAIFGHATKLRQDSISAPLVTLLKCVHSEFSARPSDEICGVEEWINRSLLERSLSLQLPRILAARTQLEMVYTEDAFMRSAAYSEALVLCIRCLEENKAELLAEIDPALFLPAASPKCLNDNRSQSVPLLPNNVLATKLFVSDSIAETEPESHVSCDVWAQCCEHCIEATMTDLIEKVLQQTVDSVPKKMRKTHRRVYSDIGLRRPPDSLDVKPMKTMDLLDFDCKSAKDSFDLARQKLLGARLRDLEVSMELERENTHLYMSEMLIAAVEQMKWRQMLLSGCEPSRTERALPVVRSPPVSNVFSLPSSSSGFVQSPEESSYQLSTSLEIDSDTPSDYPYSEVSVEDLHADWEIGSDGTRPSTSGTSDGQSETEPSNTTRERENLLDQLESRAQSINSPEAVASSLLWHFREREKQRPKPADMEWLVSYLDAPQLLLPFPSGHPVDPDEFYTLSRPGSPGKPVRLRDTYKWAPLRQQWIFSLHQRLKAGDVLSNQNFQCAGCQYKFDKSVNVKRARYCEYFGRFFCQLCHQGAKTKIPARIVHRWDFRLFPVSDFASDFLRKHALAPVFDIMAINPSLYKFVRSIRVVREKRKQLIHMWQYVRTCRFTSDIVTKQGRLWNIFNDMQSHFLQELHLYCLRDLIWVKDGVMEKKLDMLLHYGRFHIEGCDHCAARGFICELCDKEQILFPFQVEKVHRCERCGSCVHKKCFTKRANQACLRCVRMQNRGKRTSE